MASQDTHINLPEEFLKEYYDGVESVALAQNSAMLTPSQYEAFTMAAAAARGDCKIMQLLINDGYDINAILDVPEISFYIRPLCSAILASQTEMVSFLIKNGVNVFNDPYICPVRNDFEMFFTLTEKIHDMDPKQAMVCLLSFDIFQRLSSSKAANINDSYEENRETLSRNEVYTYSKSPLALACAMKNIDIVQMLLEAGAEFGEYFNVALYSAIKPSLGNSENKAADNHRNDKNLVQLVLKSREVIGFDRFTSPTTDFEQYINGAWRRSCKMANYSIDNELQDRAYKKCDALLKNPKHKKELLYSKLLYEKFKETTIDDLRSKIKQTLHAANLQNNEIIDYFALKSGFFGRNALPFTMNAGPDAEGNISMAFVVVPLNPESQHFIETDMIYSLCSEETLDFSVFIEDCKQIAPYSFEEYKTHFRTVCLGQKVLLKDVKAALSSFPVTRMIEAQISDETPVIADIDALKKMLSYWGQMTLDRQINFLKCAYTISFIPAFKSILVQEQTQDNDALTTIQCFLEIADPCAVDELAYSYYKQETNPGLLNDVSSIFYHIKETYETAIKNALHLKDTSKTIALAKLQKLKLTISGQKTKPEKRCSISLIPDNSGFIEMLEEGLGRSFSARIHAIGSSNQLMTLMPPWEYNACYIPLENCVTLTPAYVQSPNYNQKRHPAMNYASLGSTIGHEISHAFDPSNLSYSSGDNETNVGLFKGDALYSATIQKLIQQFDGAIPVALKGINTSSCVNGELTVNENFADLVGLEVALLAYARSRDFSSVEELVKDDPDSVRTFFQAYALSNRAKTDMDSAISRLSIDPHAPNDLRANTVKNLNAFHAVYGTKPGDGMWIDGTDRAHILLD